jgi:hypothetical protein
VILVWLSVKSTVVPVLVVASNTQNVKIAPRAGCASLLALDWPQDRTNFDRKKEDGNISFFY